MPSALLPLSQAKTHLNLTGETHDAELQPMIDAAVVAIEARVGHVDAVQVTERFETRPAVLTSLPVIEVLSVTTGAGSAWTRPLAADATTGVILDRDSWPSGACTVTYRAGRTAPYPENLVLAAKIIVRHLWDTQRGPSRRPGQGGTDPQPSVQSAPRLIPARAEAMLQPSDPRLGFA